MQNSGSGVAKIIISILALVCVGLAALYVVRNKPECSDSKPAEEPTDYSYSEDFSVSGGDITFEDNNTEEMDSIPNDAVAPTSSTDS